MNYNTPNDVINLPLTTKERRHDSRCRLGYHVYLSRFFYDFGKVGNEEKEEMLVQYGIWDENPPAAEGEDAESVSSLLTCRQPLCHEITMVAAKIWKQLGIEMKEGWKERARMLNDRPRKDGTFEMVPSSIVSESVDACIKQSLSMEWKRMVALFKGCVLHGRGATIQSKKQYRFGPELVILNNQFFRSFFLNHLLMLSIFGSPLYSSLHPKEIIHRSRKEAVVHILSHRRMEQLFCYGGLSMCTFEKEDMKYICCAKVNLVKNGKNVVGYVMEENETNLIVSIKE